MVLVAMEVVESEGELKLEIMVDFEFRR